MILRIFGDVCFQSVRICKVRNCTLYVCECKLNGRKLSRLSLEEKTQFIQLNVPVKKCISVGVCLNNTPKKSKAIPNVYSLNNLIELLVTSGWRPITFPRRQWNASNNVPENMHINEWNYSSNKKFKCWAFLMKSLNQINNNMTKHVHWRG